MTILRKTEKKQYFLSRDPPPIAPPEHKKEDVYENNMNVFETVDETAKEVIFCEISTLTYNVCRQASVDKIKYVVSGGQDGVPHVLKPCQGAGQVLHLRTGQGARDLQVFSSRTRQANYK